MYRDDYPEIDFNDREPVEGRGCLIYICIMFIVMVVAIVLSIISN